MKLVCGAVVLFAATAVASAQEIVPPDFQTPPVAEPRERRPYRGLFGGDEARAGTPGLTATLSAFGGHDDNVIANEQGSGVKRQEVAGNYGGAVGQLTYLAVRGRGSFTADASSQVRYYDADGTWHQMSHAASASLTLPVGRLNELSFRQGFHYSPYYQMDVSPALPGLASAETQEAPSTDVNQSLAAVQSYRLDTDISFQQPVGRGAMRYVYGFRTARFEDEMLDSSAQNAGVAYARRVSRYGTLRLGYAYQTIRHLADEGGDATLHHIDLGGGYARPLSFSRRTTVGFSAGTGVATTSTVSYRLIADGFVHHEIGRTWLVRGAYRQGLQLVELFPDPLFGRTWRATLSGLLGERSAVSLDFSSSSGSSESAESPGEYASSYGSARFRRALTQTLAAYVEYSYYRYTAAEAMTLPQFATPPFERHGIRVGLTLWFPIFVSRQRDGAR